MILPFHVLPDRLLVRNGKKKAYLHLFDLFSQTGTIASTVFTRNANLFRTFRHLGDTVREDRKGG